MNRVGVMSAKGLAAAVSVSAAVSFSGAGQTTAATTMLPTDTAPVASMSQSAPAPGLVPVPVRSLTATPGVPDVAWVPRSLLSSRTLVAAPAADQWTFTPKEQAQITEAAAIGGLIGIPIGIALGAFVAVPIGVATGLVGGVIGAAIGFAGGPLPAFGGALIGIAIGGAVGTVVTGIPLIWGPSIVGAIAGGVDKAIKIHDQKLRAATPSAQKPGRHRAALTTQGAFPTVEQAQTAAVQVGRAVGSGVESTSKQVAAEVADMATAAAADAPAPIRAQITAVTDGLQQFADSPPWAPRHAR